MASTSPASKKIKLCSNSSQSDANNISEAKPCEPNLTLDITMSEDSKNGSTVQSEEEGKAVNGTSGPTKGTKEPVLLFYYRKAKPKRDPLDLFSPNPYKNTLDLQKYEAKDVTVKVVKLSTIVVEAKGGKRGEEEVPDFKQLIKLSDYYNTDLLSATFTQDHKLDIVVPTIVAKRPLERSVPIFNMCEEGKS